MLVEGVSSGGVGRREDVELSLPMVLLRAEIGGGDAVEEAYLLSCRCISGGRQSRCGEDPAQDYLHFQFLRTMALMWMLFNLLQACRKTNIPRDSPLLAAAVKLATLITNRTFLMQLIKKARS